MLLLTAAESIGCSRDIYFFFNHSLEPTIVEAGNMVLYHPDEFQKYEYYGKDHASIFWIHFTGNGIEEMFLKFGLDHDRNVLPSGTKSFYAQSFEQIIFLQLKFVSLTAKISRGSTIHF